MDKVVENFTVKLKTSEDKLQNLTITVKNDKLRPSSGPSQHNVNTSKSEVEKVPMKDNNLLLQRLKQLQKGQVSTEQLQKKHPLPKPKKAAPNREEEAQRNKEEVQRLNLQIQEKIAQQIRPKLRTIIDHQNPSGLTNGMNGVIRKKTISESSNLQREHQIVPKFKVIKKPTRPVLAEKTTIKLPSDEQVEIYRYSLDDLNQLQSSATWELVPRLLKFKICASVSNDFDSFILKLLDIKDNDERQIAILEAAEARNFIERFGPMDFKFCSIPTEDDSPKVEKLLTRNINDEDDDRKSHSPEIERIKLTAKNDDELNELIYLHEFSNLFQDAIKDPVVKNLTFPDIVKHLVESKQAYIIEGEVRVNGKNNQEAYVSHPKGKRDVCISKMILRKHSYQGDFVRVLVKDGGEEELVLKKDELNDTATDDDLDTTLQSKVNPANRNFGCVLEILEKRNSRRVIGSLSALTHSTNKKRRYVQFNVRDPKIPSVRIGRDGIPKDVIISDKILMVVEVTGWSHDQPKGKIVEIIGEKGQLKTENAAILIQHNLNPQPFTQEILDQLPTEPFTIPASEFAYRQDLRKKCIFSIDPETARDLDDALSCEELPNGNLEIGVHISDVTYFLKENSELDEIVKEKATTIYLVDTVYHMLPVPLCLLCSLLPGSDKMAYSVFWEMNRETADIVNTRFTRSVVNSCGKLSYDHAQMVIEKEDQNWGELEADFPEIHNGFTVSDVANVIVKLQKLAVLLRTKRKENGALKIDQPKIAFKFDKDDQRMEAPVDFFKYCIKDSNRLIEEFMLLANISVAKFIYEKFPQVSLLRHHEPPNEGGLKKLVKTLQKNKIEIDVSSSSSLSASMERLIGSGSATAGMNAVLNLLVSKTMTRARYFCSDEADDQSGFWHYALSIPMYTHFTSPIRRYADVMVHR